MDQIINWLMEGDAAIRWQTLRDLMDEPERIWRIEQQRTMNVGWGAQLLSQQDSDGCWGGGIYTPKWTSTTYTLLTLHSIGIPCECQAAKRGVQLMMKGLLGETCDTEFQQKLRSCDRCIVGMILQLAIYFKIDDERTEAIVDNLLSEMMPDGGWNCRRSHSPRPHHSSFHTTFNVLEGLREYIQQGKGALRNDVLAAEQSALRLMLQHRLYKSDKTGQIINKAFTMLSFPYRWHYDVLRGLDYFALVNMPRDDRVKDAINLLLKKRRKDGRWPVQQKYPGKVFFDMEPTGRPSRWNTLRALRVLRWWNGS